MNDLERAAKDTVADAWKRGRIPRPSEQYDHPEVLHFFEYLVNTDHDVQDDLP